MREDDIKYIIDSSFILAHLLPDEKVSQVDEVFEKYAQGNVSFIASPILPFEVTNALRYAVTSKRIKKENAQVLISDFLNIIIHLHEVDLIGALRISLKVNCSIYDASYLYLAENLNIPFLTLDKKIKKLSKT